MKTTCIMCPVGCELNIEKNGDDIIVTGNGCIRGETYGKAELTNPKRMVTALINTSKGVLPVKTTDLVPKNMINNVLNAIKDIYVDTAKAGDIVLKNVCNLGVDIIVTGNY
ncbi:MAG TPA: molybdopterin oxidoreductase [Clostridiales bacterium]|nr:molybdopterin oxidoreductase [Clostridiales bacterium]